MSLLSKKDVLPRQLQNIDCQDRPPLSYQLSTYKRKLVEYYDYDEPDETKKVKFGYPYDSSLSLFSYDVDGDNGLALSGSREAGDMTSSW
jgi:hypothetical protein